MSLNDDFFGPPRVEAQGWHDDGLRVRCDQTPVLRISATPDPTPTDSERPAPRARVARPEPDIVPIARKSGTTRTLLAPPIPLIPALFHAKIRYFVGPLGPTARTPRERPDEVLKPIDESHGYRFRFAGLGGEQGADADLGPDPEAIGAWQDRARFEVADASRLGTDPLLVRIEVRYPGDDDRAAPRFEREYVLQIGP